MWLQNLLWPDRPRENASLSLRQELRNLRKTLSDTFIITEASRLRLNPACIANDPFDESDAGQELLEGVAPPGALGQWVKDVRENWRAPNISGGTPGFVPKVAFSRTNESNSDRQSGLVVSDLIAKGLKDFGRVETVDDTSQADDDRFLKFSISQLHSTSGTSLRLALIEQPQDRLRWSANWHQLLSDLGASGDTGEETRTKFFQLAYRAQEAAEDALVDLVGANHKVSALVLAFQALRDVFSMDPVRVAEAEQMLDLAYEMEPGAALLALKGLLRTNQIYERTTTDLDAAKAEALDCVRRALALEPENGLVRALCSNTVVALAGDTRTGGAYAREAIDLNPSNPLAWSTLANANIAEGRLQEAADAAARALEISRFSKNRHWWEMNSCVAAVARGDFAVALEHARIAHFLAPAFKPPLRFMVLLSYQANDHRAFEEAKHKLMQLEPDFDERHFSDPEYPTNSLRAAGLTKMKKLWI